jgi:hypothetical protein
MRSDRIRWVRPDAEARAVPALAAAAARETTVTPPASSMMAAIEAGIPVHDPPLSARDEAIFLLHTAAEIEHALLVQYLYAAYSLKLPAQIPSNEEEHRRAVATWRGTLIGIAQEEMGHLMTVQNLLLLLGGPVNFEREDFPFRSALYPFHFTLEPLSKESLAKYVLAERPQGGLEEGLECELRGRASLDTQGIPVNRVGALYARLYCLFTAAADESEGDLWFPCAALSTSGTPSLHLADDDFVEGSAIAQYQGDRSWSLGDASSFPHVMVPEVTNREQARQAIRDVAEQGEGGTSDSSRPSHFTRFRDLYLSFPETDPSLGPIEWVATRAAPTNPNTLVEPDPSLARGTITHPRSLQWAELFNARYRMLLAYLAHFLQLNRRQDPGKTRAEFLQGGCFALMLELTGIADVLLDRPRANEQGPSRAGPPFELPYTLALPGRETDRWRWHVQLRNLSLDLISQLDTGAPDTERTQLTDLAQADSDAIDRLGQFMAATVGEENGSSGPGPNGGQTSFARDIRPLFRPLDIEHMSFRFDLSRYEAVRDNSRVILGRLKAETGSVMPPDAPWPAERIALFERWMQEGHPA